MKRISILLILLVALPVSAEKKVESFEFRRAPMLDGVLDEWKDAKRYDVDARDQLILSDGWLGKGDCSFVYRFGNDGRFLYFAVEVKDDSRAAGLSDASLRDGDHIVLWLAETSHVYGLAISSDGGVSAFATGYNTLEATAIGGGYPGGWLIEGAVDLAPLFDGSFLPELSVALEVHDADRIVPLVVDAILASPDDYVQGDPFTFTPLDLKTTHFDFGQSFFSSLFGGGYDSSLDVQTDLTTAPSVSNAEFLEGDGFMVAVWDEPTGTYCAFFETYESGIAYRTTQVLSHVAWENGRRDMRAFRTPDDYVAFAWRYEGPVWSPGLSCDMEQSLHVIRLDRETDPLLEQTLVACVQDAVVGWTVSDDGSEIHATVEVGGAEIPMRFVWDGKRYQIR
jgi:hypothetical protein